jgi:hypothetical protein
MAVDRHPSRMPSPPRKPPPTTTTDGQANTVSRTETGDGTMEYGSRNGKDLRVTAGHGTERAHDFKDWGSSSEGRAPKAGREMANEGGRKERASRPGDEKADDEPG